MTTESNQPRFAFARSVEQARNVLLTALPLAAAVGAMLLFAYCSQRQVPMPLELAELPTLLLAIAAIGIVLCLFVGGGLLLPLSSAVMYADGFWPLYAGRKKPFRGSGTPNSRSRDPVRGRARRDRRVRKLHRIVRVFMLTQGVPALALLWTVIGMRLSDPVAKVGMFAAAAIIAPACAWYGYRRYAPSRWRIDSAMAVITQVVFQLLWNLQCLHVALQWLSRFDEVPPWVVLPALLVLSILLLSVSFLLVFARIYAGPGLRRLLLWFAACVVLIPAFYTPLGASVTASVLRQLGMGGGQRVVFALGDDMPSALCKQICDTSRPGHSKRLPLLLQVGERVVVLAEGEDGDVVVEFSRQFVVGRWHEAEPR